MDKKQPFQVRVGCAGWAIRRDQATRFSTEGTHLNRYCSRFSGVEINSSFYRHHSQKTYARWAESVPADFRFSVKVPREVTHTRRLVNIESTLDRFLGEICCLGDKLGPILIQLPPSFAFKPGTAEAFFTRLRDRFFGEAACEPRHASWFQAAANDCLLAFKIARVATDPVFAPEASEPGGWKGLAYYRFHGVPDMYYSSYDELTVHQWCDQWLELSRSIPVWAIFDNTALGAATENALLVSEKLRADSAFAVAQPIS